MRLAHAILADSHAAGATVAAATRELAACGKLADWLSLLERVRRLAAERTDRAAAEPPAEPPSLAKRGDEPGTVDLPFDTVAVADAYASLQPEQQRLLRDTLTCRRSGEVDPAELAEALRRLARTVTQRSLPANEDIP